MKCFLSVASRERADNDDHQQKEAASGRLIAGNQCEFPIRKKISVSVMKIPCALLAKQLVLVSVDEVVNVLLVVPLQ